MLDHAISTKVCREPEDTEVCMEADIIMPMVTGKTEEPPKAGAWNGPKMTHSIIMVPQDQLEYLVEDEDEYYRDNDTDTDEEEFQAAQAMTQPELQQYHGDMVGGAGCGNGVPMWVSQKAAPELIGKPLTSAFPFELFDETNVKRAKGYSHCGTAHPPARHQPAAA